MPVSKGVSATSRRLSSIEGFVFLAFSMICSRAFLPPRNSFSAEVSQRLVGFSTADSTPADFFYWALFLSALQAPLDGCAVSPPPSRDPPGSIVSGSVVFSHIGFWSHELRVPDNTFRATPDTIPFLSSLCRRG